ncbi:hypothetical protein L1887_39135 [Cichorium endivia]|nr:hypothetical protein L1887_39135 [Cichorium endivia]
MIDLMIDHEGKCLQVFSRRSITQLGPDDHPINLLVKLPEMLLEISPSTKQMIDHWWLVVSPFTVYMSVFR